MLPGLCPGWALPQGAGKGPLKETVMEYQKQINIGKTLMCLSRAQSILSP